MEPTFAILPLSESTNYLPINIAATTSASPTLIHTTHASNIHEIWLYAYNYNSNLSQLVVCIGGTAAHQRLTIPVSPSAGSIIVIPGWRFSGGISISAYANFTNTVSVIGSVNEILFV